MPERVREQPKKTTKEDADELAAEDATRQPVDKADKDLLDTIDDWLDEIDALLEDVEVAVNYRQKGDSDTCPGIASLLCLAGAPLR